MYNLKFDPTKTEQNNDLHSQKASLFLNQIFFSRRTNYDFTIPTRKRINQIKNVFFQNHFKPDTVSEEKS